MRIGLEHFVKWVIFQCAVLGFGVFLWPDAFGGNGYTFVLDALPLNLVGVLWLGIAAVFAVWMHRPVHWWLAVGAMALYTFIQGMFAYSIFHVVWDGGTERLAGSLMWLGYTYLGWAALLSGSGDS